MRGRTNASNGGIFLNATTDDFEVATGNSIVAGDFVEYHYDTGVEPLNSTFKINAYLVDNTTHTYIGVIGDYPTLFTYINKEITIVATYQTATTCLIMLDATHYFVFNDTTRKVGLISCTTSAITLITEEYSTSSSAFSFVRVNATTMAYKHNNSNYIYVASTDANYTTISINSKNINATFNIAGATSNSIVIVQSTSSYSTYTNNFTILDPITLNQTDYFEIKSYDYSLRCLPEIVFNDRYLLVWTTQKVGSSPIKYYQKIIVIDTVDKREVVNTSFTDASYTSTINVSLANSQNEFIVYEWLTVGGVSQNYMYWVKFDSTLSSLTVSVYTSNLKSGIIYTFGAKTFALMVNNEGYINLDTSSGKVIAGTPTNRVKEWTGSGNPLGVAKQSGNAGDTIAVYIPQVNS